MAFVKHYYRKGTGFTIIVLGADCTFFPVTETIYVGMHILLLLLFYQLFCKQLNFIYNIVVLHTRV